MPAQSGRGSRDFKTIIKGRSPQSRKRHGQISQRTHQRGSPPKEERREKEKLNEVENSLNLLTQLTLHMLEDLSIPQPQIIQQITSGVPPPPSPPSNLPRAPINRQRAYNQGLMQLELLLEVKEKLLGKGTVEDPEQWEKEIADIREKIQEIKKNERNEI